MKASSRTAAGVRRPGRAWGIRVAHSAMSLLVCLAWPALAGELTLTDSLKSKDRATTPVPAPVPQVAIPAERAEARSSSTLPDFAQSADPVIKLAVGDTVTMDVYGKPELRTTTYVADEGTILVPLAGPVIIAGLSPNQAAARIAKALKDGEFLVNPQVTVSVDKSVSQQISVLGEVGKAGRYAVDANTTILDLLAQAGGRTEAGGDEIYLFRPDANGVMTRITIPLDSLDKPDAEIPNIRFKGGDTVYVPKGGKFYIQGEVVQPSQYRLEPNMTVVDAIARAGGITRRGSASRVEIKRRMADGHYEIIHPKPTDRVRADDQIRVKESIF